MTFINPHGLYYYNVMPFGLKNVGATYQRLVTKIFRPLSGNTMEAYIDDMPIKSKDASTTPSIYKKPLSCYEPLKCAFGVSTGKFLGFMVTKRGIEANPIQLKTIMDSQTPTSKKGVHQLIDLLVALGRFISSFTDRVKPFFTTLKGAKRSDWNEKCDQALIAIKQYLTEPPILASLRAGDTLYLCLTISEVLVRAALFKEDKNRKHRPIFFISKSLAEAETGIPI